jgi:hypothetical protein
MTNVDDYLAQLPDDRRAAIAKVRDVINANLPSGYEEKLQYGMISWCVPESVLPAKDVYNKQPLALASLGSQKSHMAVYLMSVYGDATLRSWFEQAYKQAGKKLDMGKSCVRFKSLDALPLEVIGEAVSKVPVEQYVDVYRKARSETKTEAAKPAAAKPVVEAKKAAAKPVAAKPAAKPIAAKPAARPIAAKPGARPIAAKPVAAKQSAAKNPAAKKSAAKKSTAKSSTAKKSTAKKSSAKKSPKR